MGGPGTQRNVGHEGGGRQVHRTRGWWAEKGTQDRDDGRTSQGIWVRGGRGEEEEERRKERGEERGEEREDGEERTKKRGGGGRREEEGERRGEGRKRVERRRSEAKGGEERRREEMRGGDGFICCCRRWRHLYTQHVPDDQCGHCPQEFTAPAPAPAPALAPAPVSSLLACSCNHSFSRFKVEYPTLYAPPGHKHEEAFNCVQRAHQVQQEGGEGWRWAVEMLLCGLKYPVTSAACGGIWVRDDAGEREMQEQGAGREERRQAENGRREEEARRTGGERNADN
eukprot:747287-Hanusia_phi.AAC.2